MSTLLLLAVAAIVGLCAVAVLAVRSVRRDAAAGGVDAALRVVLSAQVPLTARWRHGVATPSPGGLRFRPGGPGGARFPRGRPFDLPVTGVSTVSRSHPDIRQIWRINPSLDVVRLLTPTATVELAIRPSQMDRALAAVDSPDPT